jgi:hypothetical protein
MAFDFDKLETHEGRGKFNHIMRDLGLSYLNLDNYLLETSFEERLSQMMLTKTKAMVRIYFIEGFSFA